MTENVADERSAYDMVTESAGIAAEAAELAEHIRDTDPRHKREELLTQLTGMIDDAHENAVEATMELEE